MTLVKRDLPEVEQHIAVLVGSLLDEIRSAFADEDWGGLRHSHVRLIAFVPAEGISVTELARRVRMTKQGCGQFVTHLVGTGHLEVDADPADARVRVVRRTAAGEQNVRDVTARMGCIEGEWRTAVGDQRYAVFRSVLEDLLRR